MTMGVGGQGSGVGERVSSFRDLRVWQSAIDVVERIYAVTQTFPREEMFGLTAQMRRAAVLVPSNIAEGHTREHTREYLHHLSIAQASLAELETHLVITRRLGYLPESEVDALQQLLTSLGRQLYALRNSLIRSLDGGSSGPRPPSPDPR